MKRKILIIALFAVIIIGCCGCSKQNQIVGKWETGDPDTIVNYEFTSDNRVILDRCINNGPWEHLECTYELKQGRLLRSAYATTDTSDETEDQIPVIYTVNGDTLILEAISQLGKTQFNRVNEFTYPNPTTN